MNEGITYGECYELINKGCSPLDFKLFHVFFGF